MKKEEGEEGEDAAATVLIATVDKTELRFKLGHHHHNDGTLAEEYVILKYKKSKPNSSTNHDVLYKLQAMQPTRYRVKPVEGVIHAGESVKIHIQLKPVDNIAKFLDENKEDRFLIRCTTIPHDYVGQNDSSIDYRPIWQSAKQVQKILLNCAFERLTTAAPTGSSSKTILPDPNEVIRKILPAQFDPDRSMLLLMKNWSRNPEDKLSQSELLLLKDIKMSCTNDQWNQLQSISKQRLNNPSNIPIKAAEVTTSKTNSDQQPIIMQGEEEEDNLKMPKLLLAKATTDLSRNQISGALTKIRRSVDMLENMKPPTQQSVELEIEAHMLMADALAQELNITDALNSYSSALCLTLLIGKPDMPIRSKAADLLKSKGDEISLAEAAVWLKSPHLTSENAYRTQSRLFLDAQEEKVRHIRPRLGENLAKKEVNFLPQSSEGTTQSTVVYSTQAPIVTAVPLTTKSPTKIDPVKVYEKSKQSPVMSSREIESASRHILRAAEARKRQSQENTSKTLLQQSPSPTKYFQATESPGNGAVYPFSLMTTCDGESRLVTIAKSFEEGLNMSVLDMREKIAKDWNFELHSFDILLVGVPLSNRWKGSDFGLRKTSVFELRVKQHHQTSMASGNNKLVEEEVEEQNAKKKSLVENESPSTDDARIRQLEGKVQNLTNELELVKNERDLYKAMLEVARQKLVNGFFQDDIRIPSNSASSSEGIENLSIPKNIKAIMGSCVTTIVVLAPEWAVGHPISKNKNVLVSETEGAITILDNHSYNFDLVLTPSEVIVADLSNRFMEAIDNVMEGKDCLLLCCGESQSGKTEILNGLSMNSTHSSTSSMIHPELLSMPLSSPRIGGGLIGSMVKKLFSTISSARASSFSRGELHEVLLSIVAVSNNHSLPIATDTKVDSAMEFAKIFARSEAVSKFSSLITTITVRQDNKSQGILRFVDMEASDNNGTFLSSITKSNPYDCCFFLAIIDSDNPQGCIKTLDFAKSVIIS